MTNRRCSTDQGVVVRVLLRTSLHSQTALQLVNTPSLKTLVAKLMQLMRQTPAAHNACVTHTRAAALFAHIYVACAGDVLPA